ncbi:MAG: DUF4317 domain-containing protein [Lachnospiraceae bacterium]|jgi:hypothetical protein
MNKKEVSEIKRLFNKNKCHVRKLCGCYVDAEKNIKTEVKHAFLSLDEEEMFKYINIFRSCLSGSLGRNLINLEFPIEQEETGGTQEFLLRLRDSRLEDDELIEQFYNKVIEYYEYAENYYIILAHAAYDIPGITSDGLEMDDASIYVYEHLICCICPVKLEKSNLCYNAESNTIETTIRDWLVDVPAHGFLFPAFNDRNTDIHSMLYYTRKSENPNTSFMDNMFACRRPLTSKEQNGVFQTIIEQSLGDDCSFETVKSIHENINEMIEEQKDLPEPVILDKNDVKGLLVKSGIKEENLNDFDEHYERIFHDEDTETASETNLTAANITNPRNLEVKTTDVVIKVKPERSDLIETRIIDGIPYILIQVNEHVELNGVIVKPDEG